MVRIYDTRAGQVEEIAAGRALRLYTCGPTAARRAHVGDLRTFLVSDLIRRALERRRVRVVAARDAVHDEDAFRADAATLNLRPAEHVPEAGEPIEELGSRIDLCVGGAVPREDVRGRWVPAEGVRFAGDAPLLSDVADAGLDPLAVRMAFLESHYRRPLDLTWDTLRAADGRVRRWRAGVAEWSESVSAPMATAYAERAESAFDDDLDTPAALRVLDELESDASVTPGAKFETFLHLDSLLGLDLSSDIGKIRT
ncbi:hypothetical protein ABZW11_30420 [Nonomuraea sp. NPDC004580]|uniref:hypothetical protein n=1 Tax=Nonomuraea sp. NPDC004580 TaxID=3154552 RepID=UPI0033B8CF2B